MKNTILIILLFFSNSWASLSFSDNSTDNVNHGNLSIIDNIDQGTIILWVTLDDVSNSFRIFSNKTAPGDPDGRLFYRPGADGTTFSMQITRATADQTVTTTASTLSTGWNYMVVTWDVPNGAPRSYHGDLTTIVTDVSSGATDGSGTQNDDSNQDLFVGGDPGTFAIPGDIARFMLFDIDLEIGEIRKQQFHPYGHPNLVVWSEYGFNGTGAQADYSGNGNSGTVTGATQADHVPLGPPFAFGIGWQGAFTAAAAARRRVIIIGKVDSSRFEEWAKKEEDAETTIHSR